MPRPAPLRRALVALAAAATVALTAPALPAHAAGVDGGPGTGPSGTSLEAPATGRQSTRTGSQRAARVAAAKARKNASADTPLTVTIEQLTPSTIPARGRIQVSGTVTNTSDETWSNIKTYAFISEDPLTTPAQLEAAAQTDPTVDVGARVATDSEKYNDTIDSLAPGQQAMYSFSVPRGLLGATEPGVYWFGVHALGDSSAGRDNLADGKARTFLPLVPESRSGSLPTAVVIPLRHQLVYADDGSVDQLAGWVRTLSSGGRLHSLVDLGASAGDAPVTWVVDPGLIDAVRRLAAGNPPRSLDANLPASQADVEGSPSPSPTDLPSQDPTDESTNSDGSAKSPLDLDDLDPVVRAAAESAQTWLARLSASMDAGDQVMSLPYGDLDVAGAAVRDPQLLKRAVTRAGTTLPGYAGTTSPVFSSPSGFLSRAGLDAAAPGTTVLMSDAELPRDSSGTDTGTDTGTDQHPAAITTDGRRVVVASRGAAEGGPGPDDRLGVTAMRQRLLAEAAVRFLASEDSAEQVPLTMVVPHDWNPADSMAYFSGLDVPWLDLSTVAEVGRRATAVPVDADQLRYPTWQSETELDQDSFDAADKLMRAGVALQNLLTLNNLVSGTVTDQALGTASYSARTRPQANRDSADRSREQIARTMQQVTITTPPAVTLSSSSGRFSATVFNGLDQPVTVSLEAQTDDHLKIDGPTRVEVAPGRSSSVLLTASTDESGVHDVRLGVTDKRGTPLGASTDLSIRATQVSNVIWLFIGIGAALLFGAIAVRLFRRIRNARRTPAPGPPPDDSGVTALQPTGAGTR